MICLDNLVRQYYLCNGSFKGIEDESFAKEIENFKKLDLYEILGYRKTGSNSPVDVYKERKEIVTSFYKPSYVERLMKKHNVSNINSLTEVLDEKGLLGFQMRHISDKSNMKVMTPKKYINTMLIRCLKVITPFLDSQEINNGVTYLDLKRSIFLSRLSPNEYLNHNNIKIEFPLYIMKDDNSPNPYLKDKVLYVPKTMNLEGIEDKIGTYMFECYLLGISHLPMYARDIFRNSYDSLSSGVSNHNNALLYLIDISNITEYSIKEILNNFGINLPSPSFYWNLSKGFFYILGEEVMFMNLKSDNYVKFNIKEFIKLINSKEIFKINTALVKNFSSLEMNSIFGGEVK